MRLDKFILEKNFLKSRQYAQFLIKEGCVSVDGVAVLKPSYSVSGSEEILIEDYLRYVGRGGLKLEKALDLFKINVENFVAVDIGASTGGFTDCLLQNGVSKVYAIDVGHGQLAEKLIADKRVVNLENTNIKNVSASDFEKIDIIVVDVSFISLEKIVENIAKFNPAHLVCLIKPQFENAKTNKRGIVRNKTQYKSVILGVAECFEKYGLYMNGLSVSPVKGGDGNTEFISYFRYFKPPISKNDLVINTIESLK